MDEEARKKAWDVVLTELWDTTPPTRSRELSDAAIDAYVSELRKTFAIVPKEATDAMLQAGERSHLNFEEVREVYAAMIKAAEVSEAKNG